MNPGDYLVCLLMCRCHEHQAYILALPRQEGGQLSLYDRDGSLIDRLEFGHSCQIWQSADGTRRRMASGDSTFGFANLAQPLGDPSAVRINEWLAEAEVLFDRDFIELHNPGDGPVDVGGFYSQTVKWYGRTNTESRLELRRGPGFSVFAADGEESLGHVGFKLSPDGEMIGLFDR